jgi:hypothetical protein
LEHDQLTADGRRSAIEWSRSEPIMGAGHPMKPTNLQLFSSISPLRMLI